MAKLFIIKDQNDMRKPFVKIVKSETSAVRGVAAIQARLKGEAKNLVSYEAVPVADYDANKSSVYVLYDKTGRHGDKPFIGMVFDFSAANTQLAQLRRGVAPSAHKLVYVRPEPVEA